MQFKFIGLKDFKKEELDIINKISDEHLKKLDRKLPDSVLTVRIKKYSHSGDRIKYSIHAHMSNPQLSAEVAEWDLKLSLHKVYTRILKEAEHKLKVYTQRPKAYER